MEPDIAMKEAISATNENKSGVNATNEAFSEVRPIFLRMGVLEDFKGSAYMEYGATKVIAVIERPREGAVTQAKETEEQSRVNCVVKYTPHSIEDTLLLQQREEELTLALKKAITSSIHKQKFGNHMVNIKATILDDDGCALSTAINCCGVALAVAGIPTYDMITATTIGYCNGEIIVDPHVEFEKQLACKKWKRSEKRNGEFGMVITAALPTFNSMSYCFQKGLMKQQTVEGLIKRSLELNKSVTETLKHIYVMKVKEALGVSSDLI